MFLHAIHPACLAAQQRGQDTLDPHCCKAAVVERIVELTEELPDDSPPCAIFANSLIAVGNLSTMKPALEPELETHLLQAALHAVFTLGTEKDTTQVQALHKIMPELLDAMLGNLLLESPETGSTTSLSTSTSGSCPRREPGPLRAARPCSDTPSLSLITQQSSPGWVTMWHSWLCSSVTQPRTSAGSPGKGFTGSTSCCCTRVG
ncbi:uncharacterized protein LOC123365222 isoform X2 [Mauremys mutica]|uniref:uncharacterized protein LOC123365222 isoform X2 n=1 Tax=Mauremys mutica TaxID=74926 RepID=UPI001D16D4E0|nr:uncharacterized protein LOC123365222 isoform X2 [Mauremys mutica]